jgi:hypothetical protein
LYLRKEHGRSFKEISISIKNQSEFEVKNSELPCEEFFLEEVEPESPTIPEIR